MLGAAPSESALLLTDKGSKKRKEKNKLEGVFPFCQRFIELEDEGWGPNGPFIKILGRAGKEE